jgi:hypothetical protein
MARVPPSGCCARRARPVGVVRRGIGEWAATAAGMAPLLAIVQLALRTVITR